MMQAPPSPPPYLATGQQRCYDAAGREIDCAGSGQDGECRTGALWPAERFRIEAETVTDTLTGLIWLQNANPAEFPMTWQEALDYVAAMNREAAHGRRDWRLPNRRELRSLMGHGTTRPPLPAGHPFEAVFRHWYWTSTTAAIDSRYAWYIHLDGARMFYGRKDQSFLVWPVGGRGNDLLPRTGQKRCFNSRGEEIPCRGTGQDGELQLGRPWPAPRFAVREETVLDRLTGLTWHRIADLADGPLIWEEALAAVNRLNRETGSRGRLWRLPTINELESLVDCSRHSPALPADHPFEGLRDVYWSATTSLFETDWAWALYLAKGAVGVGFKPGGDFYVWPVASSWDAGPKDSL